MEAIQQGWRFQFKASESKLSAYGKLNTALEQTMNALDALDLRTIKSFNTKTQTTDYEIRRGGEQVAAIAISSKSNQFFFVSSDPEVTDVLETICQENGGTQIGVSHSAGRF
jgi:hypothetical protein